MPSVDLIRARELIAEGRTQAQAAAILGVTRSCLANALSRDKKFQAVSEFARAATNVNFAAAAPLFLACMSQDVQETLGRVRVRRSPQSNEKELVRENVLEKLNRRARLTYGLDAQDGGTVKVGISIKVDSLPEATSTPVEASATPVEQSTPAPDVTDTPSDPPNAS